MSGNGDVSVLTGMRSARPSSTLSQRSRFSFFVKTKLLELLTVLAN